MKNSIKNLLSFLFLTLLVKSIAISRTYKNCPIIGNPCPDYVFKNVKHADFNRKSLSSFRGKFLIIDFFYSHCSACARSFPETNKFQKENRDKIQFLLVGRAELGLEEMYEKFRVKENLDIPVTFDSVICNKWRVTHFPYLIWIDDLGIVKAITSSAELTEKNIDAFLNHQQFDFSNPDRVLDTLADHSIDSSSIFSSMLSKFQKGQMQESSSPDQFYIKGTKAYYKNCGVTVKHLYNLAYYGLEDWSMGYWLYGNVSIEPVLEIPDSAEFKPNLSTGQHIYNYELSMPASIASPEKIQEVMKRDLSNFFGFKAEIISRRMPIWKLFISDSARKKLYSKGGDRVINGNFANLVIQNAPISVLLRSLAAYDPGEIPYEDQTGITENIDIDFEAILWNDQDVQRELKKHGFSLTRDYKKMNVLVIHR